MPDWYPWFPSRYRADTMHLTCEEDGIYRRLIDHYMETGLPLPDDDQILSRIASCCLDDIKKAMAKLRVMFSLSNGKLHLKKCDEILLEQASRRAKYSKNGKKGGRPKLLEKQEQKSNSKANNKLQQSTEHNITVKDNKKDIPLFENSSFLPEWIPQEQWFAFIEVRKVKKAANTTRALNMIIKKLGEFKKQGFSITDILENSTRSSWTDVYKPKPDYINPQKPQRSERNFL